MIHGALGVDDGKLLVRWEQVVITGRRWLRIAWQEDGARLPAAAAAALPKGFGLELLEKTLPYELGANTRIEWSQHGARIELLIPAEGTAIFWRPGERVAAP